MGFLSSNNPESIEGLTNQKNTEVYEARGKRLSRAAIGLSAGVLALSTVAGINIERMNEERAMLEASDDVADLRNVRALELRGGCKDELSAQANYYDHMHENTNRTHRSGESFAVLARRYAEAAVLADKNELDCEPAPSFSSTLTRDFDISVLQEENMCADKLKTKIADPADTPNGMYEEVVLSQNAMYEIQAELAEAYNIRCD